MNKNALKCTIYVNKKKEEKKKEMHYIKQNP